MSLQGLVLNQLAQANGADAAAIGDFHAGWETVALAVVRQPHAAGCCLPENHQTAAD